MSKLKRTHLQLFVILLLISCRKDDVPFVPETDLLDLVEVTPTGPDAIKVRIRLLRQPTYPAQSMGICWTTGLDEPDIDDHTFELQPRTSLDTVIKSIGPAAMLRFRAFCSSEKGVSYSPGKDIEMPSPVTIDSIGQIKTGYGNIHRVLQISAEELLIVSASSTYTPGQVQLMKIDTACNILWKTALPQRNSIGEICIIRTTKGFIVGENAPNVYSKHTSIFISSISNSGVIEWSKNINGENVATNRLLTLANIGDSIIRVFPSYGHFNTQNNLEWYTFQEDYDMEGNQLRYEYINIDMQEVHEPSAWMGTPQGELLAAYTWKSKVNKSERVYMDKWGTETPIWSYDYQTAQLLFPPQLIRHYQNSDYLLLSPLKNNYWGTGFGLTIVNEKDGAKIREKAYRLSGYSRQKAIVIIHDVTNSNDGGWVAVGDCGYRDLLQPYLARIDKNAEIIWHTTLPHHGWSGVGAVEYTPGKILFVSKNDLGIVFYRLSEN